MSCGDTQMTYAELDSWSNRLARVLLAHGAGPDRFVVLALPRSVESIVALWAVAKTGAAFAPLDPNHPPERIEHMIADSRAPDRRHHHRDRGEPARDHRLAAARRPRDRAQDA